MVNAPSTPGTYEYNLATGTFTLLTPYEVVDGALAGQLTVDTTMRGTELSAPYSLALVSKTATTINVSWSEDVDPSVGGHRIYVNAVRSGTDRPAAARTAAIGSLTGSTQYVITVTRFNSLGQESAPSNALTVTTSPPISGQPTAPSTLTRTATADTSASFSWTETTDATVTGHWRYLDGARFGTILGANVLTGSVTGLAAGSTHDVYVTRVNASGESDPSPVNSFRTTGGSPVVHDIAMGASTTSRNQIFTRAAAVRVYQTGQVASNVSQYSPRIVALTDDTGGFSHTGGASTATAVDNFLTSFYGWTDAGGVSAHANIEVHIGIGNEVDKHYLTGALPQAVIDTYRLTAAKIKALDSHGNRKYPKASLWVDMTQFHLQTGANQANTGPRWKPVAPYLDGMACSMYPPGRKQQPTRWDDYVTYCDDAMNTVIDWNATYPNCHMFATWEFGIPIDHCSAWGAGLGGEPTAQTVFSIRPRYCTGGVDSTGHDWLGFLQYIYNRLDAAGIEMHEQIYWDKQSTGSPNGPPNEFYHDHSTTGDVRANPDTMAAWMAWTPGTRLARGTN